MLKQPADWRVPGAWERFWRLALGSESNTDYCLLHSVPSAALLFRSFLDDRVFRRILFAGNGICTVPHGFVHFGWDVTVLDVSETVCRYVEDYVVSEDEIVYMLPQYRWTEGDNGESVWDIDPDPFALRLTKAHRPGGTMRFIPEDLFNYVPDCPFDVVVASRVIQGFDQCDRIDLASRFWRITRPGGCIFQGHNVTSDLRSDIGAAFEEAGFFRQGRKSDSWLEDFWKSSRGSGARPWDVPEYIQLSECEHAQENARLDAGEKMVMYYYGSG